MLRCLLCYTPFFFLRLRPPPSSTLFPYTTLFRSRGVAHRDGRDRAVRRRLPQPARLRAITGREGPELHAQPGRVVLADQATVPIQLDGRGELVALRRRPHRLPPSRPRGLRRRLPP